MIPLNVPLNLNDGAYRSFHKSNEETNHIHPESNHLPQTIKKIPKSIEKILSHPPSTKETLENLKDYYEQRLRKSEYNKKLNYTEENNEKNPDSRKRIILWSTHLTENLSKIISVNFSFP